MLFWTVVFFTFNLYWIVLNPLKSWKTDYNDILKDVKGLDKDEVAKKLVEAGFFKSCGVAILLLLWDVAEFIYIVSALKIDPLIYPTVAILVYHLSRWLPAAVMSKNPKSINHGWFVRVFNGVFYCVYFGYMFYVLVF